FLGKWGEDGTKPGQFDGVENIPSRTGGPHFLAFDRRGNIYTRGGNPPGPDYLPSDCPSGPDLDGVPPPACERLPDLSRNGTADPGRNGVPVLNWRPTGSPLSRLTRRLGGHCPFGCAGRFPF